MRPMSRSLKSALWVPILVLALTGYWSGARAQQPAPDPVVSLQQDWGAYQVAQKHVLDGINAVVLENQALKKERDDLKAELTKLKADGGKKPAEGPPGK